MKRKVTSIVSMIILCAILFSTATSTVAAKEFKMASNPENSLTNNADRITDLGFTIITVDDLIPEKNVYADSMNSSLESVLDSNVLFTADALENCTSFSSEISAAIYAGRIVAVYDPIGISQEFDAMLSMPFISVHNLSDEVTVAEENLEYIVIGKFYGVDQTGHIKINNINVPSDLSESEAFEVFYQQLNRFIEKLAINNDYSETPTVAAANDYVRIGEEGGYFLGKEKKGAIQQYYEVYMRRNYNGYDYYAIHARIEEIPGAALDYGDKNYTFHKLTTSIATTEDDAMLYKTEPNSNNGSTTYSVNIGLSLDGPSVSISWERESPDIDIQKTSASNKRCEWTATYKFTSFADIASSAWTFEPGATIRVPNGTQYVGVAGQSTLSVWKLLQLSSVGATGNTVFLIDSGKTYPA